MRHLPLSPSAAAALLAALATAASVTAAAAPAQAAVGAVVPAAGLSVSDAWFRFLLPRVPAAGYLVLRNHGPAARVLDGAASPSCGMLMLHRSTETGGMVRMEAVARLAVPPGGTVRLAPGGLHLMCVGPSFAPGRDPVVTLRFADGATLRVPFAVRGPRG